MTTVSKRTRRLYLTPLVIGSFLATCGWLVEVLDQNQVPWTLDVALPVSGCGPASTQAASAQSVLPDVLKGLTTLKLLGDYDYNGTLTSRYQDTPFWLERKCWPNVLFYLTSPIYHNGKVSERYYTERRSVQAIFQRVLKNDIREKLGIKYSWTGFAYRVSFGILVWIGLCGVTMAGFFAVVRIKDSRSDVVRVLPVDSAFMSLTYSLLTLMTWIPFRMHTEYVKYLYFCNNVSDCEMDVTRYIPDLLFGVMLLVGYILTTFGLLAQFKRLALTVFGLMTATTCAVAAILAFRYREFVARLAENWQFYLVLAIPCLVLVSVLWFLFDPSEVHYNQFKKEVEFRRPP